MMKTMLSGAAIAMLVAISAPAFAFTHHPSTPQERSQTRDLNLEQLAIAKGQAPSNMQANAGTTEAPGMASPAANGAASQQPNQPPASQSPAPDTNTKPQSPQ